MAKVEYTKAVQKMSHGDMVTTPLIVGRQPQGKTKMWAVDALFPQALDGMIDMASLDEGSADLLYGLVRAMQPNFVLETGTHKGRSTRAISAALSANGRGCMVTVDMDDYGTLDKAVGNAKELVHQIVEKSPDALDTVKKFMDDNGIATIDFAFLDGDHTGQVLQAELEFVEAHKADECWVVVDNSRDKMWPDVRAVMDEWAKRYPCIQLDTCCGFDVLWLKN